MKKIYDNCMLEKAKTLCENLFCKKLLTLFIFYCLTCPPTDGLLFTNCYAQSITWQRTYNHYPQGYSDYALCIGQTTDGNFIVGGTDGLHKIWIIKLNPYGDTIWTTSQIGGAAYAMVATDDGGCIFTGMNDSLTAFAFKVSAIGNLVWYKSYGGSDVRLYSIIKTDDGGYVACGRDWRTNIDGLIYKIDAGGNLLWMKYYLASFEKTLYSINKLTDGNYLITGNDAISYGSGNLIKTLVMKINYTGDTLWTKKYSIFNNSNCTGQYIKPMNNNYVIMGRTGDTTAPQFNQWPFIMKLDINGNEIFKKDYTSNQTEYYLSSGMTNNYYLFTTGVGYFMNHISGKVYVTDTNGIIIRQKEFNDTGQVELHAIYPINNNDILFAGYYGFYGPTGNDYYVIRSDSLFNPPPIGIIKNNSNNLPDVFKLFQNYPNPFNSNTKIKFALNSADKIKISIYDFIGKEIEILIDKILTTGIYTIEWEPGKNNKNFSSGIYFLKIYTSTGYSQTKKIVYLK